MSVIGEWGLGKSFFRILNIKLISRIKTLLWILLQRITVQEDFMNVPGFMKLGEKNSFFPPIFLAFGT